MDYDFKEFTERLRLILTTTEEDKEYYRQVVLTHLDSITIQRVCNLDSYFKPTKEEIKHRQRLADTIEYIVFMELLEGKRINFNSDKSFVNYKFKIDTLPTIKNKIL